MTIIITILASHISTATADITSDAATKRVKRMYALCPPHFERVGNQCYYISDTQVNWLDAHFACKDRNSRLAEPIKAEDHRLRRFMLRNDKARTTKWIGGMYNWQKNQWQWGYSGRIMDYQSFSQMVPGWVANLICAFTGLCLIVIRQVKLILLYFNLKQMLDFIMKIIFKLNIYFHFRLNPRVKSTKDTQCTESHNWLTLNSTECHINDKTKAPTQASRLTYLQHHLIQLI